MTPSIADLIKIMQDMDAKPKPVVAVKVEFCPADYQSLLNSESYLGSDLRIVKLDNANAWALPYTVNANLEATIIHLSDGTIATINKIGGEA